MRMTRTILVFVLIAMVPTAALCAWQSLTGDPGTWMMRYYRLPPAWWKSVPINFQPAPVPEMETYTVVDDCRLVDQAWKDVTEIWVREGTPIQWINKTQEPVSINFSDIAIAGEHYVYLRGGESTITTCKYGWSDTAAFEVYVWCRDTEGPAPPIKECPPPPAPCP